MATLPFDYAVMNENVEQRLQKADQAVRAVIHWARWEGVAFGWAGSATRKVTST